VTSTDGPQTQFPPRDFSPVQPAFDRLFSRLQARFPLRSGLDTCAVHCAAPMSSFLTSPSRRLVTVIGSPRSSQAGPSSFSFGKERTFNPERTPWRTYSCQSTLVRKSPLLFSSNIFWWNLFLCSSTPPPLTPAVQSAVLVPDYLDRLDGGAFFSNSGVCLAF